MISALYIGVTTNADGFITNGKICDRCSFECDMGIYSITSMIMCELLAVFSCIVGEMNNICIFSLDLATQCHDITVMRCSLNFKQHQECGMC